MSHNLSNSPNSNNPDIKAIELLERLDNSEALHILDVREPIEFYTHNIGGLNIPVGHLLNRLEDLEWDPADEIILICKAGIRSRTAQSILQQNGYTHTRNLTGGLTAIQRLKS
ncbi:rhodanese-like domain-containing protein [Mucilaginibacter terrae]|uniref:Rhodanese-related sulfurtransferase n=1 Tax=Mucilaginibacter terrae TaxID=1955052 RepID=A0ABU3H072_9SPHI|nr:rhodanese-like domain-containing protein [Mucilaginibacter terrae]MDT3405409.1 rhodanese-related sulfurtransferase [Mucilaginibacter terrae]